MTKMTTQMKAYLKQFLKTPLKESHVNTLLKTKAENDHLMVKLLIECWNAERPHFGGDGAHRYDGISKKCSYCNRPIDWIPRNAGFLAGALTTEEP